MTQFRPLPDFDEKKETKNGIQEEKVELNKPASADIYPLENTSPHTSFPPSATGHTPVILLTGPHSTPDTDLLAAAARKAQISSPSGLTRLSGDTSHLTVIPADKKLQEKRHTQTTPIPPPNRARGNIYKSWKTMLTILFMIMLLFAALASKVYFLSTSSTPKTDVPCLNGCYMSTNANPLANPTIASHATATSTPSSLAVPSSTLPIPPAITSAWKLSFDEEFNQPGVNWKLWEDGGKNWFSGGNGEEQAYISEACSVSNGLLHLQATNVPINGKKYSSCMLNTMDTFKQTYGYFEFRGLLPKGQGFWPAFWLYESALAGKPEIDVMENLGNDTTTYYMTYHADAGDPQDVYHGVDLAAAFHTYAVKWVPGAVTFYFDDTAQFTVTNDVYNNSMFILINLAVGGNWPGSPDASTSFPGYMNVDYVRAYAMP